MVGSDFYTSNANSVYVFAEKAKTRKDFQESLENVKRKAIEKYGFSKYSGVKPKNIDDLVFGCNGILRKNVVSRTYRKHNLPLNIDVVILWREPDCDYTSNLDFILKITDGFGHEYELNVIGKKFDILCDMVKNFSESKYYDYDISKYFMFLKLNFDDAIGYANDVLKDLCEMEFRPMADCNLYEVIAY